MPSVITDPQAYAKAIMERRRLLQMAQSGAPFDTGQMSPFMQGIIGKTDAPPNAGIQLPTVRGLANTLIPQSMRPPVGVLPSDNYPDPRIEAYRNQSQSGGNLDPEQAASDGFRIPNYVSPAQVAGGSGTYMSNAPNPVSDAQVAGGSGDYMSKVGQSPNSSIPPQDDSIFSFFGKPEATDAMAAFGAGMLRGKNFADGLANATEGVNNVAKQYRSLTPREIALLEQKAMLQRKLTGQKIDTNDPYYDKNNVLYFAGTDSKGDPFFYNTLTKEKVASAEGLVRGPDAAFGSLNRKLGTDLGKLEGAFEKSVQAAPSKISAYDQMAANLTGSGVGTDVLSKTAGYLSDITGTNIAGVDVTNRGVLKSLISSQQLIAAEVLQGQGQVTEAERKLLASSLVSMDTNEEAARQVLAILKKAEERKIDQFRKWQAVKAQNPNASFTQFVIDYKAQLDGQQGQPQQQSQGSQDGNRQLLDDILFK